MGYDPDQPRDETGKWSSDGPGYRALGHAIRHVQGAIDITQNSSFVKDRDKQLAGKIYDKIDSAAYAAERGGFMSANEILKAAARSTSKIDATGHGDNMHRAIQSARKELRRAHKDRQIYRAEHPKYLAGPNDPAAKAVAASEAHAKKWANDPNRLQTNRDRFEQLRKREQGG